MKKLEENFFKVLMIFSTVFILFCLAAIIITVLVKGLPSMNLAMITQTPKGGYYLGKEGGVLNAIVGSLYITGGATLLAILMSLPVVLFLNMYAKKGSKLASMTRFSFDVLSGVPSIVYGAFGLIIMHFFGIRTSMLGGILAVAFLITPMMSRSIDEIMKMVPKELTESSFTLGATRFETSVRVVLRQIYPGIITSVLVAFGRGIGDAASVLFTAGFSDSIPYSLFRPAATLPLAIFFQLSSPIPEVQSRAYASALILTVIILIISVTVRIIAGRSSKYTIK